MLRVGQHFLPKNKCINYNCFFLISLLVKVGIPLQITVSEVSRSIIGTKRFYPSLYCIPDLAAPFWDTAEPPSLVGCHSTHAVHSPALIFSVECWGFKTTLPLRVLQHVQWDLTKGKLLWADNTDREVVKWLWIWINTCGYQVYLNKKGWPIAFHVGNEKFFWRR